MSNVISIQEFKRRNNSLRIADYLNEISYMIRTGEIDNAPESIVIISTSYEFNEICHIGHSDTLSLLKTAIDFQVYAHDMAYKDEIPCNLIKRDK